MTDSLDVRLEWAPDEDDPGRKDEDVYDEDLPAEDEMRLLVEEPREELKGEAEFEWSEERALALEAALARMGPAPAPRVVSILRQLATVPDGLDEVEDWLRSQLPNWSEPVALPEEEDEEAPEHFYNEAVSAGADGLHLALEVVEMIRNGDQPQLVEKLLEQVEDYFQDARKRLLASEPYDD